MASPLPPVVLTLVLGAASAGAGLTSIAAQSSTTAPPTIDVGTIGPQVGEVVPDFTLPDQNGRNRPLQSLMGKNGLMLVFFRSADW